MVFTIYDAFLLYNHISIILECETLWNKTDDYSGVRLSFYTHYISPIEIGLLQTKIEYFKIHSIALIFWLQADM